MNMSAKNILEAYRVDHGLTFEKLAQLAGFSSRTVVFDHCKGTRGLSAESAVKYWQSLGIPKESLRPDLFGGVRESSSNQFITSPDTSHASEA